MGCCYSIDKYHESKDYETKNIVSIDKLSIHFDDFIKKTCIEGNTEFVNAVTLISLFSLYINNHEPNLRYSNNSTPYLFVRDNMVRLCLKRGYLLSGLKDQYCIIGLSINKLNI